MEISQLSPESFQNKRLNNYKSRSVYNDQESRRLELLENQKRRREFVLNEYRRVIDEFPNLEISNEENESGEDELMEWTKTKSSFYKLTELFMHSEWMVKLPENFEDKWLFVFCPVGKRCLVKCSKGCTTVYGKKGRIVAKFQSALPNGSQIDFEKMNYSNSDVTILDCIWSPEIKSYFILDLLSWKGQLYMDTETSFRVFWVKSKLQEMTWLSERSCQNPYPFFSLDYYPCSVEMLASSLSRYPYFNSNLPKIDGLLFYHSEGYYTPGFTPLVVWLKPFMVPEILGIEISPSYSESRPASYIDINHYISIYENKQKKRKKCKKDVKKENLNEMHHYNC